MELLEELRRRDIRLWREGDSLRFSAPAGALSPELRTKLAAHKAELLTHLSETVATGTVIPRVDRSGGVPLSFAQEQLWVLDRLEGGLSSYHVPHCWRITGPLEAAALERSLQEIERRHEILRTTFSTAENGTPVQIIHPFTPHPLRVIAIAPNDLTKVADEEASSPFDLRAGPLWRVTLARLGENEHALLFTWHHIICDAWSAAVFARELTALYAAFQTGQPNPLPELPLQFGDYAHWQRAAWNEAAMESHRAFWRERLRGDRPPLPVPADRARPVRQSHHGGMLARDLAGDLAVKVRALARTEGVTLFVLTLAAFKALLARYCGETDICIGSPIAQRPNVDTEGMIGFFLNMLALRSDLSGDPTFRELLRRVRSTTLEAFEHQEVSFEKIVEDLHPSRDFSHQPIFQVAFVLQPSGETIPSFPGATVQPLTLPVTTAKFDLTLFIEETRDGLRAMMEYSADQFDAATADRMLESLELLLGGIVADPAAPLSRLPILGAAERQRILTEWSGAERPYPQDQTIAARFAECAAQNPAAIAVVEKGARLTYAELDARANRMAHFLQSLGVRAGDFVGLKAERSLAFVVRLLGIAKAGAAYVPLDETEPAERLATMRAACGFIIDAEPEGNVSAVPVVTEAPADGPAYVLFTSGSTGIPKGVIVSHRGIMRLVVNNDYAPFRPDDVVAFASNVCFDAATFEIWGALLNGGTLVITPQDTLLTPASLQRHLTEHGITVLFLTTALFNRLAHEAPAMFGKLRHLVFGGEAADPHSVELVLQAGKPERLVNGYGPTEVTTFAVAHNVERIENGIIPIGRPIANTNAYLLDAVRQPVPIGVAGEIYLGGPGVALGYLGAPELTAERFVATEFGRLYRTGDLARWRADGSIECLGRTDQQVKLRGFRIELGEIETALQRHPAVRQGAVALRETSAGPALVAYLVRGQGAPADSELRDFLKRHLPPRMIPTVFVWLDALPLTPNGKLDHRALPALDQEATTANREAHVAPRTAVEKEIAELWKTILGCDGFSIDDDFFAAGGHSLLAIQLMGRLRDKFGVDVPARQLFETPTIAGLAEFVSGEMEDSAAPAASTLHSLVCIQKGAPNHRPFFLVPGGWGGEIEFLVYAQLTRQLGANLPLYGLKARGADAATQPHESLEEMAKDYVAEMRIQQPAGPYLLGGECVGGIVAYEMARQLVAAGEEVALLVLLGTQRPTQETLRQFMENVSKEKRARFWETRVVLPARAHLEKLSQLTLAEKARYLWQRTVKRAQHRRAESASYHAAAILEGRKLVEDYPKVLMQYPTRPYAGKVTLLLDHASFTEYGHLGWDEADTGGLEVHVLPGDHISYIRDHSDVIADRLRELIERTEHQMSHV